MSKVSAVIAAGGSGNRMQMQGNKVYLPIGGLPVLSRTLKIFAACELINEIIVVVPADEKDFCLRSVVEPLRLSKAVKITAGGKERQDSVRCGLRETSQDSDYVVVHDGARPLLTLGLLDSVIREAFVFGAATAAVPVKDTIKIADAAGFVVDTPARDRLWSIQTPQAFRKDVLVAAHDFAVANAILGTDDAFLAEKLGQPVKIVSGEYENIKITTPEDLRIAEAILLGRRDLSESGHRL
jgi:2-C-methyl-D-erythritol 4-phosphate cytidylyltransferase